MSFDDVLEGLRSGTQDTTYWVQSLTLPRMVISDSANKETRIPLGSAVVDGDITTFEISGDKLKTIQSGSYIVAVEFSIDLDPDDYPEAIRPLYEGDTLVNTSGFTANQWKQYLDSGTTKNSKSGTLSNTCNCYAYCNVGNHPKSTETITLFLDTEGPYIHRVVFPVSLENSDTITISWKSPLTKITFAYIKIDIVKIKELEPLPNNYDQLFDALRNYRFPASVASTLTPSLATAPGIISQVVSTDVFHLRGEVADGISHDADGGDPKKLLTEFGGKQLQNELSRGIDQVQEQIDTLEASPVLTDAIADPHFIGTEWIYYQGWYLDAGRAIYVNQTDNTIAVGGSLKLSTEAFTRAGNYFLYMDIERIDSGHLDISNEQGTILKVCNTPEHFEFVFEVENPSIAYLEFTAKQVAKKNNIVVKNINVHYIKPAFEVYMEYMSKHWASGGAGFITSTELEAILQVNNTNIQNYVNTAISSQNDALNTHIRDQTNVHRVTKEQVNLDKIPNCVTSDIDLNSTSCLATAKAVKTLHDLIGTTESGLDDKLTKHINNKNNPHEVTCEQIHASPDDHTHPDYEAEIKNNFDNINVNSERITELDEKIEEHKNATGNVHGLTAADIGLGEMAELQIATTQEAIDGESLKKLMTPSTTKDVLDYYEGTEPRLARTLTPRLVSRNDYTADDIAVFSVSPGHIYQVRMRFTEVPKNTTISFGSNVGTIVMSSSVVVPKNLDDSTVVMTTKSYFDILTLKDIINSESMGLLEVDTTTLHIAGMFTGIAADRDPSTGVLLSGAALTPVQIHGVGISQNQNETPSVTSLRIALQGACTIDIYELVQTNQDPAMIVDALPVGSIITRYGSNTVVPGYTRVDGSLLDVEQHRKLFDYAQTNGLLVNMYTYEQDLNMNGYTDYFGHDDGTAVFRIPRDNPTESDTTHLYRYMKIDDLYVPSNKQILYRYVWSM